MQSFLQRNAIPWQIQGYPSLFTHEWAHKDDDDYCEILFQKIDDDCSTNSFLDYCQQEGDAPEHVDSYNFVHDTDSFTPTDIPHKLDNK